MFGWLKDAISAPKIRGTAKHPSNELAVDRKHASAVVTSTRGKKNIPVSGAANAANTNEAATASRWARQNASYRANR
jgi:hypothetical protein